MLTVYIRTNHKRLVPATNKYRTFTTGNKPTTFNMNNLSSSNNVPNLQRKATTPQQLENRAYGIKELAVLYFPNIAPASESKRLKQWITDCPELLAELDKTNYHTQQRIITPRQKDLIANAFGSPF